MAVPGKKETQDLFCRSQPVSDPPWEVWGKLFLKLPKKREAIPQGRFPVRRQHKGGSLGFFQQFAPAQGSHKDAKRLPQALGGQHLFLLREQTAQFGEIFRRQVFPIHLTGGVRQLVGLVDHQCPVIIEKRPQLLQTVGGVGQQVVVVADLDENLRASGLA